MNSIGKVFEWIGAIAGAFVVCTIASALVWAVPAVIVGVIVHALDGDWRVIRTAYFWIVPSLALLAAFGAVFTISMAHPANQKGGA